jgi:hypothetical protein
MPYQMQGQRSWTFQLSPGDSYCFDMPLIIEQNGYEKLKFTAHYRTQSFIFPVYYSWKIGTQKDRYGWELELTHLKIYLNNKPPEVQHFAISHGYNYVTVNHIRDFEFIILRVGAGVIISHPENIVRNLEYDTHQGLFNKGYHFSGPGLQIAAEKRFQIVKRLFFSLEVKAAAAIAKVGVANGSAFVPQAGFHGLFGLGYSFN